FLNMNSYSYYTPLHDNCPYLPIFSCDSPLFILRSMLLSTIILYPLCIFTRGEVSMQTQSHVPGCRRMAFWIVGLLLSMWLGASQAQAQDRQLYRFYSYGYGTHFYTTSVADGQHALQVGFTWEGVAARVWSTPNLLRQPIYRLYSPSTGDHYYTISQT